MSAQKPGHTVCTHEQQSIVGAWELSGWLHINSAETYVEKKEDIEKYNTKETSDKLNKHRVYLVRIFLEHSDFQMLCRGKFLSRNIFVIKIFLQYIF